MSQKRKICYILAYRQPNYVRTKSLLQALHRLENTTVLTAINRYTSFIRYIDTLWQLITIRWKYHPDCYVLGFRGHEIFWLVKFITFGKPLIFDSLLSPAATLLEEKKNGNIGALIGKILFSLEKSILQQADCILTDTQLHVNFLSHYFQLSPQKIYPVPVGADETWNNSSYQTPPEILEVLFYGSFLPLHGMSIMLEAIAYLRNQPIHFTFIGGTGYNLREFNRLKTKFRLPSEQVTHIQWVNFSDLRDRYIAKADLGLGGPFGNTPQAQRVITGKTSQFLAMAKPTIVGAIAESVGFLHQENCLLVEQGNVKSLVNAIEWANDHREQLVKIGQAGLELYQTSLSIAKITQRLETILQQC